MQDQDEVKLRTPQEEGAMTFHLDDNREVLRFDPNGDAFVRGEKVDNNRVVYEALRDFLVNAGLVTPAGEHTLCILINDGPRDLRIKAAGKTLLGIQNLRMNVSAYQIPPVCEIDVPDPTTPGMSKEFQDSIRQTIETAQRHGFSVKLLSMAEIAIQENPEEQKAAEAALREIVQP